MRVVDAERLWLGTARDARDIKALHDHSLRAVIDLAAEEPPAQLSRDLVYCRFPLLDGDGNPVWLLQAAIETTARCIERRIPTLVACSGGMSRSPVIAAAALSVSGRGSLDDCLVRVIGDGPRQVSPGLWNAVQSIARSAVADSVL
jgi:protein-tyrosine phosphatase